MISYLIIDNKVAHYTKFLSLRIIIVNKGHLYQVTISSSFYRPGIISESSPLISPVQSASGACVLNRQVKYDSHCCALLHLIFTSPHHIPVGLNPLARNDSDKSGSDPVTICEPHLRALRLCVGPFFRIKMAT
jgi:hypothetical protein